MQISDTLGTQTLGGHFLPNSVVLANDSCIAARTFSWWGATSQPASITSSAQQYFLFIAKRP